MALITCLECPLIVCPKETKTNGYQLDNKNDHFAGVKKGEGALSPQKSAVGSPVNKLKELYEMYLCAGQ